MILSIRESLKNHLSFLFSQPQNVIQEFCKIALEYIVKGPNSKLYASAAQKLEVETEVIQHAVEGLIQLLLECCKHQLSELDFRDTVLTTGFSEIQCEVLQLFFTSQQKVILNALTKGTVDYPQFKDIEWRLEAQVASRAVLDQMSPQVTLKLSLENSRGTEQLLLASEPSTLVRLTESLEAALAEAKSQHFRRVQRRLNC